MLWWGKKGKEKSKAEAETKIKLEEPITKRKDKIYVVGSKHRLATKCFDWNEPFDNLADCDKLIINLTTLNEEVMKIIYKDQNKLGRIKKEIFTLLKSNGEIYCVITPSYNFQIDNWAYANFNYACWSPILFNIYREEGDTFSLKDFAIKNDIFKEWVDNLERWTMLIEDKAILTPIIDILTKGDDAARAEYKDRVHWNMYSIAENRYEAVIAGAVYFSVEKKAIDKTEDSPYEIVSGLIHLLPPPTKISTEKSIDNLLMRIKGVTLSQAQPTWVNNIYIPGEKEIRKEIEEASLNLGNINKQINVLNNQLEELLTYKDLLFQKGTPLGYAVKEAFEKMGFAISPYEKVKDKEDLILDTTKGKAIIEVTGIDNKSVSLEDLRQLSHHLEDAIIDGYAIKGIFIGNPYCTRKLEDRDDSFPDNVIKFAEKRDLILMTSTQLFYILSDFLERRITKEKFTERLFNSNPIFDNTDRKK